MEPLFHCGIGQCKLPGTTNVNNFINLLVFEGLTVVSLDNLELRAHILAERLVKDAHEGRTGKLALAVKEDASVVGRFVLDCDPVLDKVGVRVAKAAQVVKLVKVLEDHQVSILLLKAEFFQVRQIKVQVTAINGAVVEGK